VAQLQRLSGEPHGFEEVTAALAADAQLRLA
jgi:hypothetical protein